MERLGLFSQFFPPLSAKAVPFQESEGGSSVAPESSRLKGLRGPELRAAVTHPFQPVLGQLAEASPAFLAASLSVQLSRGELLPPAAFWSRGRSGPPLRSWRGWFPVFGGAENTAQS